MKRFKLGFGNRSLLEQIAICRRVADGIGRLPAEPRRTLAHHPVAASVAKAADTYTQVESLKTALRTALARRDSMVRAMREHTTAAANGILAATGGDPLTLLAAGVGIAKTKQPVGRPDAPTRMRILSTEFEGTVRLRWKRPVRRCIFTIQTTTAPMATRGWKHAAISIRQTCDVTGLVSGAKYWFRVSATNAHGQGPWSQPVNARVK
jgi:Fibronectin type III domain